ncbi:HlyD family secretion protein [Photobacterium sp. WH77]|uniref:HlyD family secretion protein n=1 Tax=Photobacterium arenosum TaxID=2774143 RepID=A0ABR9BHE1_9GAMM|nr:MULTISPECIES: HlyD family secretion protein [Photobacterium]MBD8511974.1 HlyD family secretion protein [Photobacterium arenosum]MCG2836219.1 HlyD family secretion protein [Photobacterium sp. WH77]MCG2843644.1 HlyD family secretion protein [Photobacterium sp. WH80]
METLLVLSYAAICIFIFKVFRIPLNKWTVPTAVLGGIILVGALVLFMNYNHPHTSLGGEYFVSTPIMPNVRGKVIEVPVTPNSPLDEGDILFKIDPTPFQAEVDRLEAQLAETRQNVLGQEASYKAAMATRIKAQAERDRTYQQYQRYATGYKRGAFTKADVDNREQFYRSAEAALEAAQADERRAKLAYESNINGQNTAVAQIQAQLVKAQFNLDSTIVRAPTDGFVTQVLLRPGMMAVPLPLRPVMTFINTNDDFIIGAFRQNSLLRLKPGFEADIIFRAIPGKTFKAEVIDVLPAIGEGQAQAQGTLIGTDMLMRQGRPLVRFKMIDDLSEYQLPLGANMEIAVYSDHAHHLAVMRKILIRMKSWQNYLYLDH